jgi:hypothetical protein
MKIKISTQILPEKKDENYTYFYIGNAHILEDESCEEIILDDCLDFVQNRDEQLGILLKKLSPGGKLSMYGLDLFELARSIHNGQSSVASANSMMYNKKQSLDTLFRLITSFRNARLNIVEKSLDGMVYKIEVVK